MLKGHLPAPPAYRAIFDAVLHDLPGAASSVVLDARRAAFRSFESAGLPGAKAEAWKYTPAASLLPSALAVGPTPTIDRAAIEPYLIDGAVARLVFVDGVFSRILSDTASAEKKVRVCRLSDLLADGGRAAGAVLSDDLAERSFDALNAALVQDGCVLEVEAGRALGAPVQIVHVLATAASDASCLSNLCHLVDLGENATAHLVETTVCLPGTGSVMNLRNQIRLAGGARLTHERMQAGSTDGTILSRSTYDVSADARLTQNVVTFGGRLVRNEIGARLDGACVEARFNGLYAPTTGQHVDNTLQVRHAAPASMSDQAYRGILSGRAKAAFAGQIVVERPAQKTNAYQSNNNLLLSPDAEINTKPELEIYADDVKCSHGATAGELDEHALFYLRSRGLEVETARSLLTYAFAGEVLERLVDPSFAAIARRELLSRLPGGADLQELLT